MATMRASRLVAMLLHIQRHSGRATAPELARTLEVSPRTIYRDVTALQEAGVPLWTEPGRDGGIRLVDGWEFPLDGLSSEETAALLVGSTGAADLGLGAVLSAAQSKVITALPPELRSRATRIQERIFLDAPGWFHRPDPVPHLETVAGAVWGEQRVDVRYQRGDEEVNRRVDPLGLVLKAGTWYLIAAHRGAPRTYRISRIVDAEVTDEPAVRPGGFDLASWWQASSREFDEAIRPVRARLRVDAASVRRLRHVVPGPATLAAIDQAEPPDDDGCRVVTIPLEPVEVAVSQLAQLPHVEVLEPADLRAALGTQCEALAALNRT